MAMVPVEIARNGDVEIAYERLGAPDGEPLLLIISPGLQMVCWPEGFCAELGARGFAVARFDHRDAGLSTHFPKAGRKAYDVEDMADDAVAVMDALGWDSAHLFGAATGGIVAMTVALRHPERVRTLGLAGTYAGSGRGRVSLGIVARMLFGLVLKRYPAGREGHARRFADMMRLLASSPSPADESWWREAGLLAYDRRPDSEGGAMRQKRAIGAAGDLLPRLPAITAPTLVIHGEADPLVRIRAGREIAQTIPDARLVLYPDMGHELPSRLWPSFADELWALASRART